MKIAFAPNSPKRTMSEEESKRLFLINLQSMLMILFSINECIPAINRRNIIDQQITELALKEELENPTILSNLRVKSYLLELIIQIIESKIIIQGYFFLWIFEKNKDITPNKTRKKVYICKLNPCKTPMNKKRKGKQLINFKYLVLTNSIEKKIQKNKNIKIIKQVPIKSKSK